MAIWCAQHGMNHTMQTACSALLQEEKKMSNYNMNTTFSGVEYQDYTAIRLIAKAEILRELAKELGTVQYVRPGEEGREEYEAMLAIRRGNTDAWLKAKADEFEEELKYV